MHALSGTSMCDPYSILQCWLVSALLTCCACCEKVWGCVRKKWQTNQITMLLLLKSSNRTAWMLMKSTHANFQLHDHQSPLLWNCHHSSCLAVMSPWLRRNLLPPYVVSKTTINVSVKRSLSVAHHSLTLKLSLQENMLYVCNKLQKFVFRCDDLGFFNSTFSRFH